MCGVGVRPEVLPLGPQWSPLGRIGVPMWAYWHPLGAQWVPTGLPLWAVGAPLSPTWGPIGGPKRPVRPLLPWREHALHGGEHALHDHQKLNDVLEIWRSGAYALLNLNSPILNHGTHKFSLTLFRVLAGKFVRGGGVIWPPVNAYNSVISKRDRKLLRQIHCK